MADANKTAEGMSRRSFLAATAGGLLGTTVVDPLRNSPSFGATVSLPSKPGITFCCSFKNDLYRVMTARGVPWPRHSDPSEALANAPAGTGVMVLGDDYPTHTTPLTDALFESAAQKKLRMYIEYPSLLPGYELGEPLATSTLGGKGSASASWERAVVTSDVFGPKLPKFHLLNLNHCYFVPVKVPQADLTLARVAGFNTAVYGLPQENVVFGTSLRYPILFELAQPNLLVSTTKLSQFVTARYSPQASWRLVWRRILAWVAGQEQPDLEWVPSVRPMYERDDALAADAELDAFRRGAAWYKKAKLFPQSSWNQNRDDGVVVPVQPVPPEVALGDGSAGVLEGQCGRIEYDGSQAVGWTSRNDCAGETSMAMAMAAVINRSKEDARIAANLNDYIYFTSPLAQGSRADPRSPSYGLVGGNTLKNGVGIYYADDNCRSVLGTIGAAALLKSDRWDEYVLRCLLANLRTTGRLGFRGEKLHERDLQKLGWRHFFNSEIIFYEPHFEAYPWATYLWAYDKTHYPLFLNRTKNAIRMMMAAYPQEWRWTNGMQQERARMLLPLAWLVRVEDTPEHRSWLKHITADIVSFQDKSGAIREEIGPAGHGYFPPPASNNSYGTDEAPLIQQNGDPACDLLYTCNFAFLGLHEAGAATGEQLYVEASDKLAKFLVRIQMHSEVQPALDGAWFRGFDYEIWECWASNADWGWGPWATETGWIQSWITSVLAMRHMRTSLWELTAQSQINRHLKKLLAVMLPSET